MSVLEIGFEASAPCQELAACWEALEEYATGSKMVSE
jgi:hypothetical protein